jgi:DNA-binding LacI/PurR family transcriptional regulator
LAGDLPKSGRAIGAILIGQWRHHEQLNDLAFRRSPVVVWGAQLPQQLYCTVGSDNAAGGALATAHLLETGRRRIAFFGDTELPEVARRFEGYQRSHTQQGLKIVPGLVRRTPFIDGSAEQAVADLIQQNIRFDAVFASSDLLAIGTINALRSRGRAVPKDVAVVGYDDIELARYYHPSLTTIRQPVLKGGEALVDALLQLVAGHRPKPQILPTELIIRESSAT